jgi:hypothetical protein
MQFLSDIGGSSGSVVFIGKLLMSLFSERLYYSYLIGKIY